ncbi:MAG TPA: hypothetical protein EYM38_06185 [Dehalococcoidia bacterium]|nr:hypothetical protein [Dehalococcoidia bacterium]
MTVKQAPNYKLFANLTIRESAKCFLISLRCSSSCRAGSIKTLENALGLLATFAKEQDWPDVQGITKSHLEE